MYTLRQFRANTKQAFDDSAAGHQVVIKRGINMFQLIALVDKPLPGHSFESIPSGQPKVIKIPQEVKELLEERGDLYIDNKLKFCKNGHVIPEGYAKCLGKGCQYN